MRQRAPSTWLTLLSVLLGVSLSVAIMILRREGQSLFAQTDFGYDVLIGPPKGSPLQLTLNTVYHLQPVAKPDLSTGIRKGRGVICGPAFTEDFGPWPLANANPSSSRCSLPLPR